MLNIHLEQSFTCRDLTIFLLIRCFEKDVRHAFPIFHHRMLIPHRVHQIRGVFVELEKARSDCRRTSFSYFALDEELNEQMHEGRVLTAFLRRGERLFGLVEEFLIEKFSRGLSHLPVRMIDQLVDILTILVLQDSFVESTRDRSQSRKIDRRILYFKIAVSNLMA